MYNNEDKQEILKIATKLQILMVIHDLPHGNKMAIALRLVAFTESFPMEEKIQFLTGQRTDLIDRVMEELDFILVDMVK